jgi:hypothetical protein
VKLAVVSHKPCWPAAGSPSGHATDGGFPMQMRALSELFSNTVLVLPVVRDEPGKAGEFLVGRNLSVQPLSVLTGKGLRRRLNALGWLFGNLRLLIGEMRRADAVHVAIPGDVRALLRQLGLAKERAAAVLPLVHGNFRRRPQRDAGYRRRRA